MNTLAGGSPHVSSDPPTRVTGDDYDVRSVSFLRSGSLLFLAKHDGRFGLYSVKRGSPPALFFGPREIASFAVSPDEDRIAFTELIRNRWQLATLDTHSGRVTVLTRADCNAYTPTWLNSTTVIYATDCGRGMGLTALASITVAPA
jgi:Tol biopolymer transport system component